MVKSRVGGFEIGHQYSFQVITMSVVSKTTSGPVVAELVDGPICAHCLFHWILRVVSWNRPEGGLPTGSIAANARSRLGRRC
jgi:hypothetical protein